MKTMKKGVAIFLLVFILAFTTPIATIKGYAATTSVNVTLEILWNGVAATVNNGVYYIAAYSDSACTNAVSVKTIRINNDSSGSVVFSNLSAGTYYFAESNSSGTLKTDTSNLKISYPTGNSATVSTVTYSTTEMVWIPKTGEKYHSSQTCSNMKDPTQVSIATAVQKGYEPCSKCYIGGSNVMTTLRVQNNYAIDPNYASAKTMDESQPVLFVEIAVLCILVGGVVIFMRKKYV